MRISATELPTKNILSHTFFKVIRKDIIAVTVTLNGIIKGFNILKYKSISMYVVHDIKSVKPFSFD